MTYHEQFTESNWSDTFFRDVYSSAWHNIVNRYNLLPNVGDTEEERTKKAREAEKLTIAHVLAGVLESSTLKPGEAATILRDMADVLSGIDSGSEKNS